MKRGGCFYIVLLIADIFAAITGASGISFMLNSGDTGFYTILVVILSVLVFLEIRVTTSWQKKFNADNATSIAKFTEEQNRWTI